MEQTGVDRDQNRTTREGTDQNTVEWIKTEQSEMDYSRTQWD